jgi:hypothetical protein
VDIFPQQNVKLIINEFEIVEVDLGMSEPRGTKELKSA